MRQHYSITRNADGTWVIRAEGRDVLQCASESDAVKTAQEANVLAEKLANATPPKPDKSASRSTIVRLSPDGGQKFNGRRT
jgi:hypothetical protein